MFGPAGSRNGPSVEELPCVPPSRTLFLPQSFRLDSFACPLLPSRNVAAGTVAVAAVFMVVVSPAEDFTEAAAVTTVVDIPGVDFLEAVTTAPDSPVAAITADRSALTDRLVAVMATEAADSRVDAGSTAALAVAPWAMQAIVRGDQRDTALATLLPDGTRFSEDRTPAAWHDLQIQACRPRREVPA